MVTGGNKGIGYAIVKELCAKFEGRVYLTARDEGRGRDTVNTLKKVLKERLGIGTEAGLGLSPSFHQLDIDDQKSIDAFAAYLKNTYGGLDVLVNNAAIAYKVFFITNLIHLFDLSLVCHVSSSCGHLSEIRGDEPAASQLRAKLAAETLTEEELCGLMEQFVAAAKDGTFRQAGWPASTYVVSKVGVSALTRIQQRALDSDPRPDLIVNSCHPGYVNTDMTSHKGPLSIEQGAVCPSHLALLPPDITEPKGAYLWHDKSVVDWTTKKPAPV
ncbi:Carbonyl reductase [NADPH] 3 [Chionoecetes opilio]|uniref:Carbonyl reductase [NADPH] 3 n=1 Tax=Chionoecetes opilio TaxID=41210 RepID=A0A8J4XZ23_CHIOP|nr:Carbonyl reductase [NADPH] 3 [Chionoecetes opilio]